jgi:hypothetical protein
VRRLPLVPPPLSDEAISSWIARVAARYDASPYDLARVLLPKEAGYADMYRLIDSRVSAPLEAALSEATGLPEINFAVRRVVGLTADQRTAWPRRTPAWCPRCVIQDVVGSREVYARREWGFGGYVICPKHNRLLRTTCPRCLQQAMYRPVDGKLRLWCSRCRSCVDTMPELVAIRTWPPRVQPAERPCRAITLQPQARSLLLQLQADLLVLLAGQQTRRMWTGKLKPQNVLGVLRDFSFVMLGPLGEAPYRAAPGRSRKQIDGPPPDDWHVGALPPEIAAPVLLTCAIFVAHETEIRIAGVNWDRRVLADGEAPAINTETMVWHLTFAEGETLRKMFGGPQVRPFRGLLSALAADRRGLAAEHEAKRRLWALRNVGVATRAEARPAGWHRRKLASMRASPRYTMNRLEQDAFPVRPAPRSGHAHDEAATAVRMALCTDPADDTGDLSKFGGTLFGNRYVHYWLMRHLHLPPDRLIAILSEALVVSHAENRGILLPELPHAAEPVHRAR